MAGGDGPLTMAGRKRQHVETDSERTLEEVGAALGLTRERTRQIEKQALAKVKVALERRGIDRDLWLSHLADLHRRQRPHYTVDGSHLFIHCRIEDEAADETCEDDAAE